MMTLTAFADAWVECRPFTLLDEQRAERLWDEATKAPPGVFVEVGVYRGGSAMLLQRAQPDRELVLFDTFAGHPALQVEEWDKGHPAGRFGDTSVDEIAHRVPEATICIGEFSTLPLPALSIALLHIDVDLYHSTKAVCERLVPLLVPGGVAICDDYGFCDGARRAIDEYAASHGLTVETPGTGQAILRIAP